MGNCISKISKDRLLALEEFMKNATSSEKGKVRLGLEGLTRGTYTRIHSIQTNWIHYKLERGGESSFKRLLRSHEKMFYVLLKGVYTTPPF